MNKLENFNFKKFFTEDNQIEFLTLTRYSEQVSETDLLFNDDTIKYFEDMEKMLLQAEKIDPRRRQQILLDAEYSSNERAIIKIVKKIQDDYRSLVQPLVDKLENKDNKLQPGADFKAIVVKLRKYIDLNYNIIDTFNFTVENGVSKDPGVIHTAIYNSLLKELKDSDPKAWKKWEYINVKHEPMKDKRYAVAQYLLSHHWGETLANDLRGYIVSLIKDMIIDDYFNI